MMKWLMSCISLLALFALVTPRDAAAQLSPCSSFTVIQELELDCSNWPAEVQITPNLYQATGVITNPASPGIPIPATPVPVQGPLTTVTINGKIIDVGVNGTMCFYKCVCQWIENDTCKTWGYDIQCAELTWETDQYGCWVLRIKYLKNCAFLCDEENLIPPISCPNPEIIGR